MRRQRQRTRFLSFARGGGPLNLTSDSWLTFEPVPRLSVRSRKLREKFLEKFHS